MFICFWINFKTLTDWQSTLPACPPTVWQVRSAVRKRFHRWQEQHSIRARMTQAMSIPTSPSRVSFHSIKQSTSLWDTDRQTKPPSPPPPPHPALPFAVIVFHHITGAVRERCPKPQEVHYTETPRRKCMRTGRKDTADFVKLEVRGSIDACDQAQFGCRWLWMWIYCTVLYFCFVFFCLTLLDCTASDAMVADSSLRSDWCRD